MSTQPATQVLLQRIQSGDQDALHTLLQRYLPRIYAIVRARLGQHLRSKLQSGDIVQDVFIRILGSLDRFEPQSDAAFTHWVSRMVANQIRDNAGYFSAQRRQTGAEVPMDENTATAQAKHPFASAEPGPEDLCILTEDQKMLEQALDGLEPRDQDLIQMRDLADMGFAEIGEALGLTADAARVAYGRAKIKLVNRVRSLTRLPLTK